MHESAQAVVAHVQCDSGYGLAGGKESQRVDQPELLTPPAECHSSIGLESSFDGSPARGRLTRQP